MRALLIGVVEAFATCDGVAEIALAIDANWGRQGLGSAPARSCHARGRASRCATLRMLISRNNWPMRQLARKVGARLDFDLDEISADISVVTAVSPDIAA